MRTLSLGLTAVVLSVGLVGYASQQPPASQAPQPAGQPEAAKKEDIAAVVKVRERYVELYNKGDAKGLAQLFTQDGVLIDPEGQTARSRGQIEKLFAQQLTGPAKDAKLQVKSEGTRLITQDVALDYGTYQITGVQAPAAKQPPPPGQAQPGQAQPGQAQKTTRGHYLVVLSRQQQQWMIEALYGAPDPPQMPGQAAPR